MLSGVEIPEMSYAGKGECLNFKYMGTEIRGSYKGITLKRGFY